MGRVALCKSIHQRNPLQRKLSVMRCIDNHTVNMRQPLFPAIVCLVQWAHVHCIKDGVYTRAESIHLSPLEATQSRKWLHSPMKSTSYLEASWLHNLFHYGVGNNFFSLKQIFVLGMDSFITIFLPKITIVGPHKCLIYHYDHLIYYIAFNEEIHFIAKEIHSESSCLWNSLILLHISIMRNSWPCR